MARPWGPSWVFRRHRAAGQGWWDPTRHRDVGHRGARVPGMWVQGDGWESPREQITLWLRLASPCRTGHCTPICPPPPTRSCSQGLGHTTHSGSRRPTLRSSNTRPGGSPTRPSAGARGHRSLPASDPAGPLTMMASACLASSSETALRKPLGCGVAALGVGMVPARSRAPLHSPLPGGSYRLS